MNVEGVGGAMGPLPGHPPLFPVVPSWPSRIIRRRPPRLAPNRANVSGDAPRGVRLAAQAGFGSTAPALALLGQRTPDTQRPILGRKSSRIDSQRLICLTPATRLCVLRSELRGSASNEH